MNSYLKIDLPIVLASVSPRRKKLLEQIGLEFTVIPSEFEEKTHPLDLPPKDYAEQLAYYKAKDIADKSDEKRIIIAADTIVVLDGKILNKPENEQDAYDMLSFLSGNTHTVITGIAILNTKMGTNIITSQSTKVTFRDLEPEEIKSYISTGSPMDKAGAYGIQDDFGAVFISHIEGCYYNIVGLPLELLYSKLKEISKDGI